MTPYSYGDVVVVAFPFTNQQATKRRPAVVINSMSYGRERPDVILMAVTSRVAPLADNDEALLRDWSAAGLLKPSALKPLVATLSRDLVTNVLGRLSAHDRGQLTSVLAAILG